MPKSKQNKQNKKQNKQTPMVTINGNAKKNRPMMKIPRESFGPVQLKKKAKDIALSRCALKYALAIAKPFHPSAKGACLPVFPSPASQKVTGYARFNAFVGSGSYGFVTIQPCLANDGIVAFSTTAAYTLATASPLSANSVANVGVTGITMANLPYPSSLLGGVVGGNNAYGRIISCGVRISYVGTTLNESGSYYLLTTPGHENVLAVANTLTTMGSFADCNVCSITRETCETSAYPISPLETQYSSSTANNGSVLPLLYPYSGNESLQNNGFTSTSGGYLVGSPIMGIQFNGVQGSSFLVEIITHCEYIGAATASVVTVTDSDQRGFEIVTAAAERMPQLKIAQPARDPLELLKDAIYEVAEGLKPYAVSALTAAGMALLM